MIFIIIVSVVFFFIVVFYLNSLPKKNIKNQNTGDRKENIQPIADAAAAFFSLQR